MARRVQRDVASARASGASESPTFFINGTRYDGPHDADNLVGALMAALPVTAQTGESGRAHWGSRTDLLPPWRGTPGPARGDLEAIPRNLDETPDTGGILPRLSDANLDLLADEGNIEFTHDGQVLFERYGNDNDDLYVVLSGAVAIAEYARNATPEISVHERGRFLGEADLLTRQASSRTAVVIRPGRVARLDRAQQQAAFRRDSRLRDVIVRTLLLRRSRLLAEVADLMFSACPRRTRREPSSTGPPRTAAPSASTTSVHC